MASFIVWVFGALLYERNKRRSSGFLWIDLIVIDGL